MFGETERYYLILYRQVYILYIYTTYSTRPRLQYQIIYWKIRTQLLLLQRSTNRISLRGFPFPGPWSDKSEKRKRSFFFLFPIDCCKFVILWLLCCIRLKYNNIGEFISVCIKGIYLHTNVYVVYIKVIC